MLIFNSENNHAYVVGEVVTVKDADDYFLVKVKHRYYDTVKRVSIEVVTAIFIRNIAEEVGIGRPAIPFADRARKMRIHVGSRVGVYCVFGNDGMKTAKGYGLSFDGITSFKGVNKNHETQKFGIVMGAVKSLTDKIDRNGAPYVTAHVYVGKWPQRDANGALMYDIDGNVMYEYRYVDVNAREKLAERFHKALEKTTEGQEKAAAFLCGGMPFTYNSPSDGKLKEIYSGLNFELMGLVPKR